MEGPELKGPELKGSRLVTCTHPTWCPRRIKLTNAKIKEAIVEAHGALDALRALGWVEDPEAPGESLIMPPGLYFTMKEVSSRLVFIPVVCFRV